MSQEPQFHFSTTDSGIQHLRTWCNNIIDSCSCSDEEKNFARSILATFYKTDFSRTYQEGDSVMGKDYCGRPYKFTGVSGTVLATELNSDVLVRWNTQPQSTISGAHPANLQLIQPSTKPRYTVHHGPTHDIVLDKGLTIATIRRCAAIDAEALVSSLNKESTTL